MNDETNFYKAQIKILNQAVSELSTKVLNLQVDLELMNVKYIEAMEKLSVAMAEQQISKPHTDNFGNEA